MKNVMLSFFWIFLNFKKHLHGKWKKTFENQNVKSKRYFSLAYDNFSSRLLLYEFMFTKMIPKET